MNAIGFRLIPIPDYIDIFHLSSEIEASDMTALEAVLSVDEERALLEHEAQKLSDMMADEDVSSSDFADDLSSQLVEIYDRLDEMDSSTAESKAANILAGLGFTAEMQKKATREFSGGWRMRISLARALYLEPTLLLLDEPTNHLDMEAVVWLEEYLKKFKRILLMISHSEDFLNNVCTNIINFHSKELVYYTGNYDQYTKTRSEKEENQMKQFNWEQDQIKHMKDYIARFGHGSAKLARQAQSKEKVLAKMEREGLTEKVVKDKVLSFYFPDPDPIPPPVLQFQSVGFGYPGQKPLYMNVECGVDLESRIALVGPNGAGKTTLIKLMAGELTPTSGMVRPHSRLRMCRFTQHFVDILDMNTTPLDYVMKEFDLHDERAASWLGRFGISGGVQLQKIEHLSEGQKARLVFSWMAYQEPHMLLLDEPTNHLDIETIDSLAAAINAYGGGVVLVSHDMRLISKVAKEIWQVADGKVQKYPGSIEDYKKELRKHMNLD
jgi:ATP-binding cassette subfamily F protein 2